LLGLFIGWAAELTTTISYNSGLICDQQSFSARSYVNVNNEVKNVAKICPS